MSKQFVYVTYIRTTPKKLWDALTKREFTSQYWRQTWQDCKWTLGSAWKLMIPDGRVGDSGELLEYDPPKRFVVSWRNEFIPAAHAEGYSRAAFELEPAGEAVKLTVTHEFKTPNSELFKGVSASWPLILASLKSLLETGEPLEATRYWPKGV